MPRQNDPDNAALTAGEDRLSPFDTTRSHLWCRLGSDAGAGMAEYTFLLLLVALPLVLVFPDLANAIEAAVRRVIAAF